MNRDFEKRSREVFEVLSILAKTGEGIVFLGGSAIQATLPEQRRLSIDLDITYSGEPEKLILALQNAGYTVAKRQSRNPIFVFYTVSKGEVIVKLDISRLRVPKTEKKSIRGFEVLLPTQEYFLASKLSSLAFGSVGRMEEEQTQTIKDIFDINCLLDNRPSLEGMHESWLQIISDQNRLRNSGHGEAECAAGVQGALLKCVEVDSKSFFIRQSALGSFQDALTSGRVSRNDLAEMAARALLLLGVMGAHFYEIEKTALAESKDTKKLEQAEATLLERRIFGAAQLRSIKITAPRALMYLYHWLNGQERKLNFKNIPTKD